ncbi:autophagy-related protein 11-like [Chenopodium quinoa]|uniref:autophagy-related protein 11-like n=1 Tax=Chenopodium quinoa TaxID=63459 RepID=UPI000B779BB2|nr:autophagy-related protein 11-like [Chenopodium quinoa]
MSSNVTGGYVAKGKLLIHIAENGHSYELECDDSTVVEAVQKFIESVAGIQFGDQLLLCGDMKLESNEVLGAYKLPSDEQEVFCFNKARLQANAARPPPEQIEIHVIPEPTPPSSNHDAHPLDNAVDPALKALPSYERQFRYHYHCGHAIYSMTIEKFEICERLLREQKVQERAIEIARRNLDYFFRILNQNYMDFLKCYSQQHRTHSDLLLNFTREIEKLRSCKLIPALQTSSRKCLLDLVKEENLRKWVDNCNSSHKQFENKVSQFKHVFGKLKHDVEELFSSKASLPIRDLELMIKEQCCHINEQRSIMQSLSKDVSTVKKLVDDCLSSQMSSSLRPHDAVSALGPMYDVHDKNHLPKMTACDSSISDLLDYCTTKKNEMNSFVHSYMQKIAYIQHTIKDVRLQFNAFSEAIKRQDAVFEGLKIVRGIGPAYRSCLAEVVRRKASMKLYMGMAGQLAEKLATKREDEVRRREEFLKAQSSFIPRDVLAAIGLFDTPSQCDVNIVPFDTSLLDIDIRDIDCYAPESLVGLPFKSEKSGSSRTSLSMSNSSSYSGDVERQAIISHENYEDIDVCDLVDVAGTSKMEVENAKLRADLASAIAQICSFSSEVEYDSLDDSKIDNLLKNTAEKTAEALQQKDEYIKHLESMLKAKHQQCQSYEKRIEELAQQLSEQYMQARKCLGNNDATYSSKSDDCRSGISDHGERQLANRSGDLMDEISCTSNPADAKDGLLPRMTSKAQEVDENMTDSSGIQNPHLDSSMMDPQRDEQLLATSSSLGVLPSEAPADLSLSAAKVNNDLVLELQSALEDKANQLTETESRLKSVLEDVSKLGVELENSRKLLDESQMNCAHLENCLHEARQEAQTHLCAADRRASEYNTLRASAVKMRGLFERLKSCVNASGGVAGFADSLRSLAQSLASSASDGEDDGNVEFRACIRVLADKVGILSRQRAELLDRYSKAEAANKQLSKDLEERKEMVKTLYTKHQHEKQANKEKISFCRFEVHEIAAFILNSSGHYEAISRNCPNYFLSPESVALFTDHLPNRPAYIIGQIVHIERRVVKPHSGVPRHEQNSGGDQADCLKSSSSSSSSSDTLATHLPVGCEYFIVTVAMLPDTTIHSPVPS